MVLMGVNAILVQATIRMSERAMGGQPGRAGESAKNGARHLPRAVKDADPTPGARRPPVRLGRWCQDEGPRGAAPSYAAGGREGEQRAARALRPGARYVPRSPTRPGLLTVLLNGPSVPALARPEVPPRGPLRSAQTGHRCRSNDRPRRPRRVPPRAKTPRAGLSRASANRKRLRKGLSHHPTDPGPRCWL